MIAFDADILGLIFEGNAAISQRAERVPPRDQAVPIVVVEEILRGRLNSIRQAESPRFNARIQRSYELLGKAVEDF